MTGITVSESRNRGIIENGTAVLYHRNGGSESPGILKIGESDIMKPIEKIKTKYESGMKLSKWYYKQRNSIAHYRAANEPVRLTVEEWNSMIKFNFEVIEYLYDTYK